MIAQESHYHTPDYNYCSFLRVMLWKHKAGFYSSIVFLLLCVTVDVFLCVKTASCAPDDVKYAICMCATFILHHEL